jgi:nucleotide-binding universal stress UspA family protein
MLRSILVGMDGSAYSSAAVELAIRWAKRFDAFLVGLGIVDEPTICKREPVPIGAGHYKVERDQWLLTDARRRVESFLDRFVRRCAIEGVKCEAVQDVGVPAIQIVQKSRLCDLIMLGQQTHFHFETQNWPDETLRDVLRRGSRPVVAVPEAHQDGGCVLAAYDGSRQADRALQAFQASGLADEDEVQVLSVQADRADAERLSGQAVDFLGLHGVKATPLPIRSTMSTDRIIIVKVQEVRRPHLLVMGAYGRSMWQEFVFGSVTTRVLQASPVPVFLCR